MAIDLGLYSQKTKLNYEINLYKKWKSFKKNIGGYFLISNSIEEYLPYLNGGATNLYLFYLIHAKNDSGYSFYSTESIANQLEVSVRTISNWNKILIDLGLISRQSGKSSSRTYILPTSNFTIFNNTDDNFIEVLKDNGYHHENDITLCQKAKNGVILFYKYTPYFRKYSNGIKRYVFVGKKIDPNVKLSIINSEDLLFWFKISNDETGYLYNGDEKVSITNDELNNPKSYSTFLKNVTSLLTQISDKKVQIRKNFPEIK